jgi:hypothetical protein
MNSHFECVLFGHSVRITTLILLTVQRAHIVPSRGQNRAAKSRGDYGPAG